MTSNISTAAPVNVTRAVTLNGQNHKLSFSNVGQSANLVVTGSGATVKNLTVENTGDTSEWNSTYCVQFYNGTYDIANLKATGGNAGIIVNGSTATIGENVDVSGNSFGGIEVSKGTADGLGAAQLTVNSAITNTTETYGQPTVWTDGADATVIDNTGMTATTAVKEGQTQYYIVASNATQ